MAERGVLMSGGERQRLALARVLLQRAPLLLLDEPTAHLDSATENGLVSTLSEACRGRSALWITHSFIAMEQMDQILVFDRGKIVERGAHSRLIQSSGLYARLWSFQHNFKIPE